MKTYIEILTQVEIDFPYFNKLNQHFITGVNHRLQRYNDNFYELSKHSIGEVVNRNMNIVDVMNHYSNFIHESFQHIELIRLKYDVNFVDKHCIFVNHEISAENRLYYNNHSNIPYYGNYNDIYNFCNIYSIKTSKIDLMKLVNFVGIGNIKKYMFGKLELTNDIYFVNTQLCRVVEIDENNELVYTEKQVIHSNAYRNYRLCNHTQYMYDVFEINSVEIEGFGYVIDHEEILQNYYYSDSESNFYVTEDYYYDNRYEEEEEKEEEVYLRSYHNNQSLTHTFNNESLFRIGFEVEKEDFDILQSISINDFESETNYRKESDGSLCSDSGFELISPIYEMNTEKIIQHISENRIIVNHLNASANYRTCGTHINISKIDESGFSLYPYIENYLPMLYAMYPNRTKTDYCKAKSKENIKNDNEKYQAVKIHDNRIELRIFPVVHSAKQLFFRLQLVELMLKNPIENFTEFTKVFEWYFKPFLLGSKVYDSEKLSKLQTRISHYAIKYNFLEDSEDSENQFFDN
jgi:hypothetical protein